jgi:hypothetical protein
MRGGEQITYQLERDGNALKQHQTVRANPPISSSCEAVATRLSEGEFLELRKLARVRRQKLESEEHCAATAARSVSLECGRLCLPHFDSREMAKRVLGLHWRDRTADERKEFTRLFTDLVEKSYRRTLNRYTSEVHTPRTRVREGQLGEDASQ